MTRNIYKLVEYVPKREFPDLLRIGLFLRNNSIPEIGFRDDCVHYIPRCDGFKCGLSCSTDSHFGFRFEILGRRPRGYTKADLKRDFGGEGRAFLVCCLDAGQSFPIADWHVENDGANHDPAHVTLAPARELEANEPGDCLHKVSIPALEQLPWVLVDGDTNPVLILRARADWRDDYFPDNEEWKNFVIAH